MDKFSKEKRSSIMRKVKSKKNKSTEIKFLNILKSENIHGWIRHYKVKEKPDFAFVKQRIAIFIDGCFWHGHDCKDRTVKSNVEYWENKIINNIKRDKRNNKSLKDKNWDVIRIWECELRNDKYKRKMSKIKKLLNKKY